MLTLPPNYVIAETVSHALAEDIGTGDWTAQLIPLQTQGKASVVSREQAVICGQAWFEECFRQIDPSCQIYWKVDEGTQVSANTVLCDISGPARALLTAERSALNFLQSLSAVATETQLYVQQVAGTKAKILDTRKTLPGMRLAQKYAVTAGGGHNQRIGLFDGVLIKENHIMAAGSIRAAVEEARRIAPAHISIQVEVENLDELQQALDSGVTLILLDNMSLDEMKQAVEITAGRAELEASGGINMDTIKHIAQTGVDRISIGKLTKDIRAIDFSMRFN